MVFRTWDLNFRAWEISGHGFQDLGSHLWGLDFHTRGFQDRNLKTFRTWFSGYGISILGPGFHTGGFTVAFGHGHPLVEFNSRALGYLLLLGRTYVCQIRMVNCKVCFIVESKERLKEPKLDSLVKYKSDSLFYWTYRDWLMEVLPIIWHPW